MHNFGKEYLCKMLHKTFKNFCVVLLIDKAAQFRLKRYETAPPTSKGAELPAAPSTFLIMTQWTVVH